MSLSDPIADMLNRVRNAHAAGREMLDVPGSRVKREITRILKKEGFINDFAEESSGKNKIIRIYLKYTAGGEPAIRGLKRISTPGLRRYTAGKALAPVLRGMGISILTTSMGIMTDKDARKKNIGGEILCKIW